MAEPVKGVVRGRAGDEGLCRELGPAGEVGPCVEHGGRVELCADEGRAEVPEEEGVHGCVRASRGGVGPRGDRGEEANQHADKGAKWPGEEMRRGRDAPAERPAPVARLAIDDMDVSWGW